MISQHRFANFGPVVIITFCQCILHLLESFARGEKRSRADLAQQPRFRGTDLNGGNHLQRTRLPRQRLSVLVHCVKAAIVDNERPELLRLDEHNHDVLRHIAVSHGKYTSRQKNAHKVHHEKEPGVARV